jgi:hypothetical protein
MSVLNPDDKTKVKIILHQMIAEQYLTLTVWLCWFPFPGGPVGIGNCFLVFELQPLYF